MKKLFAFLAAALIAAPAFAESEFPDISITELKEAIAAKKAVVIDVNGTESYKKGHVPTALNFAEVKEDLAKKLPGDKNALVVAYCGNEKCSAYKKAAQAAKELGYTNVKHLAVGIKGWKEAGEQLEKAE